VNHTRFPKEDQLLDWARRENKDRKGDRVEGEGINLLSGLFINRVCENKILTYSYEYLLPKILNFLVFHHILKINSIAQ